MVHKITREFEYIVWTKFWYPAMQVNPCDLLPVPNDTNGSRLTLYGLFKNFLFCFVLLGGLYLMVDEFTNHEKMKVTIEPQEIDECDDSVDTLGYKKFSNGILNAENEKLNGNVLNLLKNDVTSLKNQVLLLWSYMNDSPSTCDIQEIENKIKIAIKESDVVDAKIKHALNTYDADKLALYDYAADYAGGEVIAILETVPYPTSKILQLFGLFKLTYSSSPDEIIKPSTIPGDCFRFYGHKARIILKLGKKIHIGSISMEHSPLVEDYSDAPKDFRIFGLQDPEDATKVLLGSYTFNIRKHESAIQTFPVSFSVFSNNYFEYIELEILSNQGHPLFTSIYRFRIHAGKNKE